MKLLHSFRPSIQQTLLWYGRTLERCNDPYHGGFPEETRSPTPHQECAATLFRWLGLDLRHTFQCECQICLGVTEVAHYFTANDARDASNRSYAVYGYYAYMCDHCIAQQHPQPQPRPTT